MYEYVFYIREFRINLKVAIKKLWILLMLFLLVPTVRYKVIKGNLSWYIAASQHIIDFSVHINHLH